MMKFAHMADVHLGAHREPALRKLEMRVFYEAMDLCVSRGMDFVLISGDLFHVGIPDLGIVNEVIRKMRELQESGIPIYAIYGSHDYNPSSTSIIDIIETTGLLTNISKWKEVGGKIELKVFEDKGTGAKLCGISARKMGLESKHYELLDKRPLEELGGFKVFAFHSGITEFKPEYLSEMETIPISSLPEGFDYYAGGHIHQRGEFSRPGYERVVFPGPLFTGYGNDIETTARGERRGFYEVQFDEEVRSVSFVPMKSFGGAYAEYDATGRNGVEAASDIRAKLEGLDVADKVVALKVRGELTGGKTTDIGFAELREGLMERGALFVYLNRHSLTSRDFLVTTQQGEDPATIESRTFEAGIVNVKVGPEPLRAAKGVQTAKRLLQTLRQGAKGDESKKAYTERIIEDGETVLGLKETVP
jgi:DNA repair exonuclease SbcCD nuclease subunit